MAGAPMNAPSEDHGEPRDTIPAALNDARSRLPRRRRQTSLMPRLAAEVPPPPEPEDRTPERARDVMAAFQRGTRRAREAE
jgi:hypothetical protein